MELRLHPVMVFQMALVFALLPVFALWPPKSGPMMLVALPGTRDADLMNAALAGGVAVLGTGPFGGTLIVQGDRTAIERETAPRSILTLAAPFTGCSTSVGAGA